MNDLGGTLFGAGFLGTLFEAIFRKDQDEANAQRFREIIQEQAPAIRDAVIDGFAIHPKDLQRVATPELLDEIAANVMSLRLGDTEFAREIYADIRDQAIRATERWHDVEVRVRLSKYLESSTVGTTLFNVTVEWEYTTVPSSATRKFACVADRGEYEELLLEKPTPTVWFMTPRPGIDAKSHNCFELLSYTIDGKEQSIRRTTRKSGQLYTILLDHLPDRPVRVRYIYRTLTSKWGHRLYVDLPQPSKDFSLNVDYTDTEIAELTVTDTIGALNPVRLARLPDGLPGRSLSLDVSGWLLPRTGFAFTWTLEDEMPQKNEVHLASRRKLE